MVSVVYNISVDCPFSKKNIQKVLNIAAKYERKIKGVVEVSVVSAKVIRQLNKKYRGKDKVTDVLSFPMQEGGLVAGPVFGEIYIYYGQILKQAKEFKVSVDEEFVRMLAHGFLHLAGHDHIQKNQSKKMFEIQEKIVKQYLK